MQLADDPLAEGLANAADMLTHARRHFAGACLMPPFDHYEGLIDLLPAKDSSQKKILKKLITKTRSDE